MRLEINNRKATVKHTHTRRLNNMLFNNQEITEEIKERKKSIETDDNKTQWSTACGMQEKTL